MDRAVMGRAAELGVSDRVKLMGFRSPGDAWIAALDVLLVTAVEEPFGRTLIEAMLLGTPVVASQSGGNLEAIEHDRTGLLATPDDCIEFAKSVEYLLRDPAHVIRLTEAARAEAYSRYSINGHVQSVQDVYRCITCVPNAISE
jgi:glycosyltransferase involved in cell wall biosynthesis